MSTWPRHTLSLLLSISVCILLSVSCVAGLSFSLERTIWGINALSGPFTSDNGLFSSNQFVVIAESRTNEYYISGSTEIYISSLVSLSSWCLVTSHENMYKVTVTGSSGLFTSCRFGVDYVANMSISTSLLLHDSPISPPVDTLPLPSSSDEYYISMAPYSPNAGSSQKASGLLTRSELTVVIEGVLHPSLPIATNFAAHLLSWPLGKGSSGMLVTTSLDFGTDCITDESEVIFTANRPRSSSATSCSESSSSGLPNIADSEEELDFTNPEKYFIEHPETKFLEKKSQIISSEPSTLTFSSRAYSPFRCYVNLKKKTDIPLAPLWAVLTFSPVTDADNVDQHDGNNHKMAYAVDSSSSSSSTFTSSASVSTSIPVSATVSVSRALAHLQLLTTTTLPPLPSLSLPSPSSLSSLSSVSHIPLSSSSPSSSSSSTTLSPTLAFLLTPHSTPTRTNAHTHTRTQTMNIPLRAHLRALHTLTFSPEFIAPILRTMQQDPEKYPLFIPKYGFSEQITSSRSSSRMQNPEKSVFPSAFPPVKTTTHTTPVADVMAMLSSFYYTTITHHLQTLTLTNAYTAGDSANTCAGAEGKDVGTINTSAAGVAIGTDTADTDVTGIVSDAVYITAHTYAHETSSMLTEDPIPPTPAVTPLAVTATIAPDQPTFILSFSSQTNDTQMVYLRQASTTQYISSIVAVNSTGCDIIPIPDSQDGFGQYMNYSVTSYFSGEPHPIFCSISVTTLYNTLATTSYIPGVTSLDTMPLILAYFIDTLVEIPAITTAATRISLNAVADPALAATHFDVGVYGNAPTTTIMLSNLWNTIIPASDPIVLGCTTFHALTIIVDVYSNADNPQQMLDFMPRPNQTDYDLHFYLCSSVSIPLRYRPASLSAPSTLALFVGTSTTVTSIILPASPWQLRSTVASAVNEDASLEPLVTVPFYVRFTGNWGDDVAVVSDFSSAPLISGADCVNSEGVALTSLFEYGIFTITSPAVFSATDNVFVHQMTCNIIVAGKPVGANDGKFHVSVHVSGTAVSTTTYTHGTYKYKGATVKYQKLILNLHAALSSLQLKYIRRRYHEALVATLYTEDANANTVAVSVASDTTSPSSASSPYSSPTHTSNSHVASVLPLLDGVFVASQYVRSRGLEVTMAVIQSDITIQDLNLARFTFTQKMSDAGWSVIPQAAWSDLQDTVCVDSCSSTCFQCDVAGACDEDDDCYSGACVAEACVDAEGVWNLDNAAAQRTVRTWLCMGAAVTACMLLAVI